MLKGVEISFFLFISACKLHIPLKDFTGSLVERGSHMPEEMYNKNWLWNIFTCLVKKNRSYNTNLEIRKDFL